MASSVSDVGRSVFIVLLVLQIPLFILYNFNKISTKLQFTFTYYSAPQHKPMHSYYITEKAPSNITWIDKNPIYSKYNIKTIKQRKHVTIIIIISTAPRRLDRRMAIRETFWKECVRTKSVSLFSLMLKILKF